MKTVIRRETNDPFQATAYDDDGIAYMGLVDFLLDPESVEKICAGDDYHSDTPAPFVTSP